MTRNDVHGVQQLMESMRLLCTIVFMLVLLSVHITPASAEVGDLLTSTSSKSLDVGESWNLEEDYALTIKQINIEGNKIWLSLSKYNSEVDSKVLSNEGTYVYGKEIGSKECTILRATVGEIDKESRTVRLDSVCQYSDGGVIGDRYYLAIELPESPVVGEELTITVTSDNAPTNGARVQFAGENLGLTDSNGKVRLTLEEAGTYIVTASKEGYLTASSKITVSFPSANTPASSTAKLISPLNGVLMDNGRTDWRDNIVWDFDWSDVKGATQYQLYATGDNVPNPMINTITSDSSYHYISQSYCSSNIGWTWKVRAKVNGQWSGWSETRSFQVEKADTDQPIQTVTQPTPVPTSTRTLAITRHTPPVATSTTNTSQQSKTSEIFPVLLILGLLCVVGYMLVRSSPEGGWTAKLIDAVKHKYYGSDSDGMQMSNRNAILLPDKRFGGALGGAISGAIITVVIWNIADAPAVAAIGGIIVGLIGGAICGTVAAMAEEDHATAGATAGGIGSAFLAGVLIGITEGFWDGLWGFISCGIVGAIMGGLVGSVGNWTGGMTNKMREKQLQYRKTVPGLFDSAKNLSTEANTLFKQGNYTKALQTYDDALDNFNKASNGALATGDADLVGIITNNTTTIEENIVMCKNLIGTRITEEAKNRFEIGNFRGALQSYEEALRYLEDPDLVAKANDSIEICYREIDVDKVEELSNRAVSMLNEATSITESFKARDMLKQADDVIDEAVAIAMKRNFAEAHQQLNMISKNIRTQRNVIDDRMADGGEVVSGGYGVGSVTGKTGPSISTIASEKPIIKRETEFFSGFIRLKMAVINPMNQIITDVSIDLDFDENTFRLDRYEPESYPTKKEKVQLGTINPGTSKTVAFYLDPMTCAKVGTDINCRMDYKDAYGKPDSIQMKSKKEKWVCPEFRTENDINIGMLKEFIENLPHHDSKFYKIPAGLETNKLIEICRETIQMHDVRHVRTFHTTDDKTCETWYYGKTKVYKSDIVIKASIREETESIEIFAATPDNESLTGLLAELGHNLTNKIKEIGKKSTQIVNVSMKNVVIQRSPNLLNFCDMNDVCRGDIIIEDSVIQRSKIGGIGDGTGATSVDIRDSIVQRSEIDSTRCQNCGEEVQTDAEFCTECGTRLG